MGKFSFSILEVEEDDLHLSAHPALSQITKLTLRWSAFQLLPTPLRPYPDLEEIMPFFFFFFFFCDHTFKILSSLILVTINLLPVTNDM